MKKISFVVPVFNEEKSIRRLYQEIKNVSLFDLPKFSIEIIFINDGSTDSSLEVMKSLRKIDSNVEIISFRKNCGKSIAVSEGFRKSAGDIIVTLDADLQDDPANVKAMIEKMDEGYDMVVGWKKDRQDPWAKILPSKIFNIFVRNFSGINLHDFNSGLKVFKREVIKNIRLYGELHRFKPVLAYQAGFSVTEIPVKHRKREYGTSKFGWERFLKGFFDFLTVMFISYFGQRPLHFFGMFGMILIIFGIFFGTYLSIEHFHGHPIGTRPLLTLAVLLIISGIQLISTGLIAEMIVSKHKSEEKIPIEYETMKRK